MNKHKAISSLFLGLLFFSVALTFPIPAKAESSVAPTVWVRYSHKSNRPTSGFNVSINEFDLCENFTLELWVDMGDHSLWSWQAGIRFNPAVLECIEYPVGLYVTPLFQGQMPYVGSWRPPTTVDNTLGFATFFGQSLVAGASPVSGIGQLGWWKFHVKGYCNSTLNLTQAYNSTKPEYDLLCGVKLNDKVDGIVIIDPVNLIDGWFHNCELKPSPHPPTAVITQKTPEPYYVGDTIELHGGDSLPGFDGTDPALIISWFWDFENDGIIDDTGVTVFWNTSGYLPGNYDVNLTVYAPGGPNADPAYNATMQYASVIDTKMIYTKVGECHDHHINDPTDSFPNDYAPMIIPVNGKSITIAPVITCTCGTGEPGLWRPHYYPCKLAQTFFVDNDWSDKNANYTYVFEDWTDYDWNDINVSLYAVTNDIIEAEIRLVDREAGWKNPFGVEITPSGMAVEVHWNSTDYPGEHVAEVDPGDTLDIELFNESNPHDTAFTIIILLIPPTASFVYSPPEPLERQTVTFDASASTPGTGTIISYYWDFGDGETDTGKIVTHAYTTAGTYIVTLNVTNSVGKWDTESKPITVKPKPVGGHAAPINISVDKSNLPAPQIGLAFIFIAATAVTIILIRRRNKTLKWER